MNVIETAATITDLAMHPERPVISISMQALSGMAGKVWWYRMPATTTIMFWLGEEHVGDHLDVASRCGADLDKYRGDWDCDIAFDDGRHMSMYAMEWQSDPATALCPTLGGSPTRVDGTLDFNTGVFASRITHPDGEPATLAGRYPDHIRTEAWERWSKACLTK